MESAVVNYLLRFDYPVLESKLKKEQSITDNELENLINSKLLLRYTFKDNSKDIAFISLSDWSNNTFPMNKSGIWNPSSKENNKETNEGLTAKQSIPAHQFQKKVFKAPVLRKNNVSSKNFLKYSPVICKNLVEQLTIPPDFFPSEMAQEYGNYHFSSESVRKLLPILPPFTFPLYSSFTLKDFSSPLSIKKEISNISFSKPECNVYKNAQAFNEQSSSLAASSEIKNSQSSLSTNNSDYSKDTSKSSNFSSSSPSSSSSSSLPDCNSIHQNVTITKRRFVRPLHPPLTSVMTPHPKPDVSLNKREMQKENQQHSFFFISLKRVIDKANKMIADEEKERKEKEEREQRSRNDPESLKAFESKLKELDDLSEKWKQIVIQLSQKLYPSAKELYHQQVFLRSCNQVEGEKRKEEEKDIEVSSQNFMENSKHKRKESEVEESEDGEEIVKEKISEKDIDNNYFYSSSVNNMPENLTMTMFLKQFGIEPDLIGYNETTDTFI